MRSGIKRLISLLTALVMVCSLIAVPAVADAGTAIPPAEENVEAGTPPEDAGAASGDTGAAADSGAAGGEPAPAAEENVTVTIVDGEGYTYNNGQLIMAMYANDSRNTESYLRNNFTTILKGTVNGTGEEVEIEVKWEWSGYYSFVQKGFQDGGRWWPYNFYSYDATVKGHPGYKVTPSKLSLQLWVLAVNANVTLDPSAKSIDRETVLEWENNGYANWESELGLPKTATITYKPGSISDKENLNVLAGELQELSTSINIKSWQMGYYYTSLTGELLRNAVREGREKLSLWAQFDEKNGLPAWASLGTAELKLTINPSTEAYVTFTSKPIDITYGEKLTLPMAKATGNGSDLTNATFVYLYSEQKTDYYGKPYWSSYYTQTPPTDAGTYRVTARVYSPNSYQGEATTEFTIKKASAVTTSAYLETNPDGKAIETDFLPSSMRKGLKLFGSPPRSSFITAFSVWDDGTIHMQTNQNGKDPGYSETYTLNLTCNNYESVTVELTVAIPNPDETVTLNTSVQSPGEFDSGTALKDIVDLDNCTATVGNATAETVELVSPDAQYMAPGSYNERVQFKITCGGKEYQAYANISFTIKTPSSVPETAVTITVADKTYDGTPVTATATAASVTSPAFYITYEGINGTEYPINTIAPSDAGTYRVTANLITPGYSGSATEEFTISKVTGWVDAIAFISVPNGEIKTVQIDETFITSTMAKGAKIKVAPTINEYTLIESCTAPADSDKFILKSKSDAPNGTSQGFILALVSDNYENVRVNVTVYNDTVAITGAKLKGSKTEFESGTVLKDIVDLSGCTATINGTAATGTFVLMEPGQKPESGEYTNHTVMVLFATNGKTYQVEVSVPNFTVKEEAGDDEKADSSYLQNGYFIVLYADHSANTSAEGLLSFVQAQKGSYTIGGTAYTPTWRADSGNPKFEQKGYTENVWYAYSAAVNGRTAKAYIRVLPVNAVPVLGNITLKARDIETLADENAMKTLLGLPESAGVSYTADITGFNEKDITGAKPASGTWRITGWKLDGKDLTLAALKAKAAIATSLDVTVALTPVYTPDAWATVTGTPTYTLTITPKTPVLVTWNTPTSIVYGTTLGELLELGKSDPTKGCSEPDQNAIGDGGTDSNGTWQYFYYNSDGTTKLSSEPKNAGTYKVQAVLVSSTHSGASELKEFEIKPRSIDGGGFTFTPPTGMDLTYNKQPQKPVYTVEYTPAGGTKVTLVEDTDYTVRHSNNINAGTADAAEAPTVTFTGKGNYDGTKEVTFTIKQCPLDSNQKPAITGTAAAGQVLSASLDGVDAEELEWTWMVDGTPVDDCKALGYTVRPEDSNKVITVTAKAKADGNYSGESGVSKGVTVARVTVTGTVTITADKTGWDGKIAAGTELTATASVTPDAAKTGGTWSWKVNGAVKEDAAGETYTVEDGDKEIIAVFTPNENYTGTIESSVIEVGKIPLTGTVTIGSTGVSVGDMLMATVTGYPKNANLTYTWLRNNEPISGAAGDTYTIAAADRGKAISVKVTAEGYTGERVSNHKDIPAVKPGAPTVTVTPGVEMLTIKWEPPADNGGATIIGYKLKVKETYDNLILETTLFENERMYKLEGLRKNVPYAVEVQAINSAGESAAGTATGIPTAPPTPPTPGGGGGGGWSGGGGSGGGGGKPSTNIPGNPEDKITTVETLEDGTVVTTVTDGLGYVARTEERPDGSILSTVHHVDGCNGTIETDTSGKTIAVVDVPADVARAAVDGDAVLLPVVGIRAHRDIDKAPAMVVNTFGVNGVKVHVPIENKGLTVVAVEIKSDGTPVIVKNTIPTEDGIMLRMDHLEVVRFLDNRKSFADTQGHWAADAIDFVSSRELLSGTAPDTFSPDAEMTRAMLVTALARYSDVDTAGGATWYEKGAAWAVANGLSDGTRLNDSITREQLATILYRYAVLNGKAGGAGGSLNAYTDADRVSSWAVEAMSWAVDMGLIKGTSSTSLDPQGSATRAQVAAIFMRYTEMFGL